MLRWSAASRDRARKPLTASGTSVPTSARTTALPDCCRRFLNGEKCSIWSVCRSPTTMSASPRRIGSQSRGMSRPAYWLSPSVLTMMSAPSCRQASRPVRKAAPGRGCARGARCGRRRAAAPTSTVRSVLPSSMTRISTSSMPGIWRGMSATACGSVCSSLKQGIWMMSFMGDSRVRLQGPRPLTKAQTRYTPRCALRKELLCYLRTNGPHSEFGIRRRHAQW